MTYSAIGGILCIVCMTAFFTRWAAGAPEAVAWPRACFATRLFLFCMGLIFTVRGVTLLTGSSTISRGGVLALSVITGYSVVMMIREIKAMPPRMRGSARSIKPRSA